MKNNESPAASPPNIYQGAMMNSFSTAQMYNNQRLTCYAKGYEPNIDRNVISVVLVITPLVEEDKLIINQLSDAVQLIILNPRLYF